MKVSYSSSRTVPGKNCFAGGKIVLPVLLFAGGSHPLNAGQSRSLVSRFTKPTFFIQMSDMETYYPALEEIQNWLRFG